MSSGPAMRIASRDGVERIRHAPCYASACARSPRTCGQKTGGVRRFVYSARPWSVSARPSSGSAQRRDSSRPRRCGRSPARPNSRARSRLPRRAAPGRRPDPSGRSTNRGSRMEDRVGEGVRVAEPFGELDRRPERRCGGIRVAAHPQEERTDRVRDDGRARPDPQAPSAVPLGIEQRRSPVEVRDAARDVAHERGRRGEDHEALDPRRRRRPRRRRARGYRARCFATFSMWPIWR